MHNATHRSNSNTLGPTPIQQAAQQPEMRLRITNALRSPALYVDHDGYTVLAIYAEPDGPVRGDVIAWYTIPDGSRYPLIGRLISLDAKNTLQTLLAGLDFAAARKAREALAS